MVILQYPLPTFCRSFVAYYLFSRMLNWQRCGLKSCIIQSMKHLITLLAIYGFFLIPAQADVTEYDFELIIFEDTSGRYANSEQWQYELPEAETASAGNQPTNKATNADINISQIKGIGLSKYAQKLKSNKRYNVLVHKAWRQTGLADDDAIAIPIDSRKTSSDGNNIHGSIKIVLGRYLHIYTDMIYQQPRKDNAPEWQDPALQQYMEYPINFHRRMRSKELHYLDHPLVGILVMAMPVKKQEEMEDKT